MRMFNVRFVSPLEIPADATLVTDPSEIQEWRARLAASLDEAKREDQMTNSNSNSQRAVEVRALIKMLEGEVWTQERTICVKCPVQ